MGPTPLRLVERDRALIVIRIALAGMGFMGRTHLEAYSHLPDVEIVAVCTRGGSGASEIPDAARVYTDFAAMISMGGFDAVDICLPTGLHPETAVAALEAGYPVLCEKPLALDLEGCSRVIEASNRSKGTIAVAHCLRFWPAYAAAKRLIDSGRFGRVLHADLSRVSPTPDWASNSWLLDPSESGGAALDFHIHDADMILDLFGPPEGVCSRGLSSDSRGVYHLTTLYEYSDFVAVATGGWTASASYGMRMEARFLLEAATVEVRPLEDSAVKVFPNEGAAFALEGTAGEGYLPLLSAFASAVDGGDFTGLVTAEEGARSVSLCLSEIRSVRETRAIRFPPAPDLG